MDWNFMNPDDIEYWFYEIDLSIDEKIELLPKLAISDPISTNQGVFSWDAIHNIEGTVYRAYGEIGNVALTADNVIVRLEPIKRHSGR